MIRHSDNRRSDDRRSTVYGCYWSNDVLCDLQVLMYMTERMCSQYDEIQVCYHNVGFLHFALV